MHNPPETTPRIVWLPPADMEGRIGAVYTAAIPATQSTLSVRFRESPHHPPGRPYLWSTATGPDLYRRCAYGYASFADAARQRAERAHKLLRDLVDLESYHLYGP